MKHLKFLVCGKAGVGKSSLINSLAGYEVCRVNDPGLTDGHLSAGTKLNKVTITIDNSKIDIYESPGLQDGTASESVGYLNDMYQQCKDVDLFLYCVDMTSARFGTDDIEALGLITKTFGENIWSRCLLVMTKANMVSLPASVKRKGEERDYHRRLYNNLLNTFRRHLTALGVPNSDYTPACAAGLCNKEYRYIWYVSDKEKKSERPMDFLDPLWDMCRDTIENRHKYTTVRGLLVPAIVLFGIMALLYLWSTRQS